MLRHLRHIVSQNYRNSQGWSTKRKFIVIESDDWGTIRMPTKEVYDKLLKSGIRVNQCPYNSYDSLAGEEDLSALFDVLTQFKDKNGNFPIITANTIVANPDFDKIRASGFKEYHYELFTETLKRYHNNTNAFQLWKQGLQEGIFFPQFHGREHVNVNRWMRALQDNLVETHLAFDNGLFGLSTNITSERRGSYMATLDFDDISELEFHRKIISDGLNRFEEILGYRSMSYIAANYVWHRTLEPDLAKAGIKYLQGTFKQHEPVGNSQPYNLIRRRIGETNVSGQIYFTRNCNFEPSIMKNTKIVYNCMSEIASAFRWNKPAIISSHRLNFIGAIVPENRTKNLNLLAELLKIALQKWPEIEFVSTIQLGDIIKADR